MRNKFINAMTFLIPLGLLITYWWWMGRYSAYFINSDASSELILARTLAEENRLITDSWYYSTELRVLNTQLIWMPLFKLFSDWHVIRVVGATLLMILLYLSAVFLGRSYGLTKAGTTMLAVMTVLPYWGVAYLNVVIQCSYYIPHIIVSFVTLGCIFRIIRTGSLQKAAVWEAVVLILALFAGMGGLRQILVLYAPIFISSAFCAAAKIKLTDNAAAPMPLTANPALKCLLSCALALAISCIGYLINCLWLAHAYTFMDYSSRTYEYFDISRFVNVINGFINAYGYKTGQELFSPAILNNLLAAVLMVTAAVAVRNALKGREADFNERFLAGTFLSGAVVFVLLYGFSSMDYTDRYIILILALSFPLLAACCERAFRAGRAAKACAAAVAACFLIVSYQNYAGTKQETHEITEKWNVVDTVMMYGCYYGYASFWNANVLTELSDGQIEVHAWGGDISGVEDLNNTFKWLQLKKHDTEIPTGKVFCLFGSDQWEVPLAQRMEPGRLIYESDDYRCYLYESHDQLAECVASRTPA